MADDRHYKPRKNINCVDLLAELKDLSPSRRQFFRSISLSDYFTDDRGNHNTSFRRLAAFLIDWEEIEEFTIKMPDDMNASENCDHDHYLWWGRLLPRLLLGAFAQGRWREVRLVHPRNYSGFPYPFLFHNIEHYVEEWILPRQPRLQCEESRYLLLDQVVDIYDSRPQLPKPTKTEVNEKCEREWDRRGIDCRLEDPRPGEQGTVITIRWKKDGMQEKRRQMVHEGLKRGASNDATIDSDRFPWQALGRFPSFLQSLPKWRVVLCTKHGNCFTTDKLQQHLIHFHGASDEEAKDVLFSQECHEIARSWKDAIQPTSAMGLAEVRHLPLIQGYACSAPGCQYRGVTLESHAAHMQRAGFSHWNPKRVFMQTLSAVPGEIHYFDVYPQGDWLFERNAAGVMECISAA